MQKHLPLLLPGLFLLLLCPARQMRAQDANSSTTGATNAQSTTDVNKNPVVVEKPDPLKRRISDRQRLEQQKDLKNEIKGEYKKWVNEDVRWIITDQEMAAFKQMTNDEERDEFIEAFWQRRNPNADDPENTYRDEHYRRIAYANEHYAAGEPGWKTDRGMIYIKFGKPDSVDSHPSGGEYDRPMEEGGGQTTTYPFEIWHYRYLPGIGDNIDIEFVDACMCNEYRATIDRSEKDALKHTPGLGATMWEQMGQAKPEDRLNNGIEQLGTGPMSSINQSKQFDRLETFTKLMAPPPIQFKDLEAFMVTSKVLSGPPFDFDVRTDYVKVTNDMVMVPVTLQIHNKDITFNDKDGASIGTVNILGRVTTLTGKQVQYFEETVKVDTPTELKDRIMKNSSVYWKGLLLSPGLYKVDIVLKDVNKQEHVGRWSRSVSVPRYDDDHLAASSLILASTMERVPSKDIGQGNFVIGNTRLQPRVSEGVQTPVTFHRGQNLNFWMQVYNLGIDEKSKQNGATIEYEITDLAANKSVLDAQENSNKISPNSDQVTLEKSLSLASLQPGKYKVTIKVNDGVSKQQIAESAPFEVD